VAGGPHIAWPSRFHVVLKVCDSCKNADMGSKSKMLKLT